MAPASPPLPPPQQIISRFFFCIYLVPGAYKLVEVVRHLVRMKHNSFVRHAGERCLCRRRRPEMGGGMGTKLVYEVARIYVRKKNDDCRWMEIEQMRSS